MPIDSNFRLLAWNIRAGGGVRAQKIVHAIRQLNPTLVILAEFRSTPASQLVAAQLANAGYLYQKTTTDQVARAQNALLIAAKHPIPRVGLKTYPTEAGRWLAVRLTNPRIAIGAVHIPNQHTGRKPAFHDAMLALMQRWRGGPCIIAGDTNSGKIGEDEETAVFNQRTTQWFEAIHAAGWRDAFRLHAGSKREYTWYSPGHNNGFRLDQAFVSPDLRHSLRQVQHVWPADAQQPTRRDALSDHAALLLDLALP